MKFKYIETSRTPSGKFFTTTNFTTAGGTGASPGTTPDDRWAPGYLPPRKWCVKEATIWGTLECIPPEPPPELPPGHRRQAISDPDAGRKERRVKIDFEWKVECTCVFVNMSSSGLHGDPSSEHDTPPDGRVTGLRCKKGKRHFHFFHNSYEYDCRPARDYRDLEGPGLTTTDKRCHCLMPYSPPGTTSQWNNTGRCSGKLVKIIDLLDQYSMLFRLHSTWLSNGAYAGITWGSQEPTSDEPADGSMKAALEKCKVKKVPLGVGDDFYYKVETYAIDPNLPPTDNRDNFWTSDQQLDCLNNLICCEEGQEDTGESNALLVNTIMKKIINTRGSGHSGLLYIIENSRCIEHLPQGAE